MQPSATSVGHQSLPEESAKPYHRSTTNSIGNRTTADVEHSRMSYDKQSETKEELVISIELTERQSHLLKKLVNRRIQIKQDKKTFLKMRKRCMMRKLHIEELVKTEKDYIQSIHAIIQHLRTPLVTKNLISQKDNEAIFGNIDSILALHTPLEKQLSKRFEVFTIRSIVGDVILKNAPFFKIYVEYVQMYLKGSALLYQMAAEKVEIQQTLDDFKQKMHNDARSYLVKPVQRFQKYHVLLQPIIKQTDPEHKDYDVLSQAYKKIRDVVDGVNEIINKIENSIRFNELCHQYQNQHLYDPKRQFYFEVKAYWITGELQNPVTACFFTDLIIFIARELTKEEMQTQQSRIGRQMVHKISDIGHHKFEPKIVARFSWDKKKSIFQNVPDGKTIKNLINLSTESGPVTISTGETTRGRNGQKEKENLLASLKKYMVASTKDNIYRVEVTPLGTEELNSTSLSKHTIYIIQVKIGDIRQNLYIRFKEMIQLSEDLQQKHPELSKRLPSLTKKWLDNHRSKTIETRKLAILEFLQVVLNDPDVRSDPSDVVKALKLRDNFYEMPKLIEERMQKLRTTMSKRESTDEMSAFEILCATELKLGRYSFHESEVKRPYKGEEATIDICLVTGGVERVTVNEFDTVEDVCNKVSRKLGLGMSRDFRLFHEVGKKESRALDHDQVIMKLFELKQVKEENFFTRIKTSLKSALMPDTRPILVFKKYYYLPFQKEQFEFKRDLVRLRLLVFQVFSEIHEHKYQLTYEDYAFFAAMYLYIDKHGEIQQILKTRNFNVESVVEKLIPDVIFKNESLSFETWKNKIMTPLQKLNKQIDDLKAYNMTKIGPNTSPTKLKLLIQKQFMCYQVVMNKIKANSLYNSNLFYVQPHDNTLVKLQKKGIQTAHNMWLAIKPNCMSVLKPSTKQPLFEIRYEEVNSKKVYPSSVIFETYEGDEYRFNTYQSFEISQLVEYNKTLSLTLEMFKKDKQSDPNLQQLMLKTSMYVSDIQSYRNST